MKQQVTFKQLPKKSAMDGDTVEIPIFRHLRSHIVQRILSIVAYIDVSDIQIKFYNGPYPLVTVLKYRYQPNPHSTSLTASIFRESGITAYKRDISCNVAALRFKCIYRFDAYSLSPVLALNHYRDIPAIVDTAD
jgi:hypothetical protein